MTSGLEKLNELRQKGYLHQVKAETVVRDGIEFTKTTLADRQDSEKAGKISRFAHGAGCVLGSVLNVSADFRNATWSVASKGYKEETVLTGGTDPLDRERIAIQAKDQNNIDNVLNNFDLKNPADIQKLRQDSQLETIRDQLISDGRGNFYLPVDDSSFILVPEGDFSKLTVVPMHLTKLIVRLGYDPKIRSSIRTHLERPDVWKHIIVKNGNYYLPEDRRDGTSSFLFVPKGDMSKASSIKVSNSKTGEALKGATLEKMMLTYGNQYEGMVKGIEKAAEERALSKAKIQGLENDEAWIQREKERILKSCRIAVMSPRGDHARIYGKVDPNAQDVFGNRFYNSPFGGMRIDWDKETAKEIKELWEKKPDDKLTMDRPFADSNRPSPNQQTPQSSGEPDWDENEDQFQLSRK